MDIELSNKRVEDAMAKFPIQRFEFDRNPNKAMNACSFGIIGSSKSGKTTFLKYLLKQKFEEDIKVLMTQSPASDIYTSLKKETAFAPNFLPEVIRSCYMINKHTKNHYPFCIIVDDVIGVKNDRQMAKLLCLYRNSRMSAVVCGQDLTLLNATGRANVNYLCLFRQNTENRIEDNVRNFCKGYFPKNLTMDEKCELYDKLTKDHCFLFIDQLNSVMIRCKLKSEQIID